MSNQSKMLLISIISIAAIGWILFLSPAEYVPEKRGASKSVVIIDSGSGNIISVTQDEGDSSLVIINGIIQNPPKGVDSVLITGAQLCIWPQIDWNWFKEGYRPELTAYIESVNGRSGHHIIGDTLYIDSDDEVDYYGEPLVWKIKPTFRDTINNSK